jgi:bifunctional N-acetylglucosamine-1-phosphate-uridyltransferase/glucosamine-1-phosphate-acetyltransferase GlmU-like protein
LIVVVGHGKEEVQALFSSGDCEFVTQEEQLGSGHAVQVTKGTLAFYSGPVLVLSGDVPLLRRETLERLLTTHRESGAVLSLISCEMEDPRAYGRVLRDGRGRVIGIRESADASPEEASVREINSGIYVADKEFLFQALSKVSNRNAKEEYYLTDVVGVAAREGRPISCYRVSDPWEIRGVNTPEELRQLEDRLARI